MGDTPTEDGQDRSEETAKLELPALSLPRFGRGKRKQDRAESVEPEPAPVADVARSAEREPTARVVPEAAAPAESAPQPVPERVAEPTPAPEPTPLPGPEPARAPKEPFALPPLPGRAAAAATGLVTGAFGAILTYLALSGCDAVRGAKTCGGTGLLLLVVILVLMVLLGGMLLGLWDVSDPRSTSFLAVGVLSVLVLLTLMEQLFSPWMFLLVPVLSTLSYLLSHWVTTAFVEPRPEKGPEHDVR